MNEDQKKWLVKTETEFTFRLQEDIYEIHWEVAELGIIHPLQNDLFWENPQPVTLLEREMLTFSPENLVLFLCLHGAKHQWELLKWVADLINLCQSYPNFDWSALLARAKRLGMQRVVLSGMQLAYQIGGVVFSQQDLASFQGDQQASKLASQVISSYQLDLKSNGLFDNTIFYLKCRERLHDRLYFIFDQIFVPKQIDWLTVPLPKYLYPLYFLIRPLRLSIKFAWSGLMSFLNRFGIK